MAEVVEHPPLSEHKVATLGRVGHLAGVWGDDGGICLVAVAAWHPGDGHWATEAALAPRRRTVGDETAAIERTAELVPTGEPYSFWAFRPGQVDAALGLGYVETRAVLRMSGPMPAGAARSTSGISIGAMTARDVEGIVDVNNRAFAGHREQGSMTVDGFGSLMSLGWFDPTAVHVARSGERVVVAASRARVRSDTQCAGPLNPLAAISPISSGCCPGDPDLLTLRREIHFLCAMCDFLCDIFHASDFERENHVNLPHRERCTHTCAESRFIRKGRNGSSAT